jgi:spermidine synthase
MATPAQRGGALLVDLRLRFALALIGFTSVIAQIVLMRELFVVCHGNELSLGLTIAVWLFWTAFGSGILGHLFRHAAGRRLLAFLEVACAAALPGAIVVARASRSWWHATPGETLGPVPMIVAAVATLAVFCPMSGWLFTAGSRAYAEAAGETPSTGASSTYLFEAIGSAAGGVLASLLLIRYFNSMQIAGAVAACNVVAAVCLVVSSAPARRAVAILAVTAGVAAVFFASRWESYAAAGMWPGFRVLATKTSPYGSLAVLESEGNRSVVQNGNVLFTAPDPPSAEEAVHFALLEHPHPRAVLLIGGGLNGSITWNSTPRCLLSPANFSPSNGGG